MSIRRRLERQVPEQELVTRVVPSENVAPSPQGDDRNGLPQRFEQRRDPMVQPFGGVADHARGGARAGEVVQVRALDVVEAHDRGQLVERRI